MLYGIHLWADLETAIGAWAAAGQTRTTCVFVILITHPKSYTEMMDRPDFGSKLLKWSWGLVLSWKILKFCSMGGTRSKKAFFAKKIRVLFDYPVQCAQPTGNRFTPNQCYWRKAKTLKVCLLLVWRVCDQAFGRYSPLKGAEKWSRDHGNWKFAYRHRKLHWFQKCYCFWSTVKNNEVIAEKPFQHCGVTRRLWHFQHATVL